MLIGQPEGEEPIFVRVGRYGPFLEQGDRRASLPDDMPPDEMTLDAALELLGQRRRPTSRWACARDTHKPVFLKLGRFGPYVQRGTPEDEEKPKNASLLKGMKPEDVTLPSGPEAALVAARAWACTPRAESRSWFPTAALVPM